MYYSQYFWFHKTKFYVTIHNSYSTTISSCYNFTIRDNFLPSTYFFRTFHYKHGTYICTFSTRIIINSKTFSHPQKHGNSKKDIQWSLDKWLRRSSLDEDFSRKRPFIKQLIYIHVLLATWFSSLQSHIRWVN